MVAMFNSVTDIKQPTANSIAFIIISRIFSRIEFSFFILLSHNFNFDRKERNCKKCNNHNFNIIL